MSQALPTSLLAMPSTTRDRLADVDHAVTHEEWIRNWVTREERWELVDGIPLMTPYEHPLNLIAADRLNKTLDKALGDDWYYLPGPAVRIVGDPRPTYRIPDFAFLPRGGSLDLPLDPGPIVLVAETLSPSTRAEDLGRKRLDYASVGIPNYLIIDRERTPRLVLLTDPADGNYRTEHSGETVTLRIAGHDITVRADDLFR